MRLPAVLFAAVAMLSVVALNAAGADDAISKLMHQSQDLPTAPPKAPPEPVAGPTVGTRPQGPLPVVMSARIGEHDDRTRLVIELSDPVNLRAFALAGPDRVVIDMPEVSWRLGAPPRPSGFGAVKSYRYGTFRAGNSRMVIALNQPVTVSDALVIPPSSGFGYRVVIDLFPTTRPKLDALAGWPADLKARDLMLAETTGVRLLADCISTARSLHAIDRARNVCRLPYGVELPLSPFFGGMGVAPRPGSSRSR